MPATIPFVSHLSSSYQCHPGDRLLSFCCCDTSVRRECIAAGKTRSSQFMLNTLAVAAAAIRSSTSQSTIGHTPTHTDSPLGPTTNMGNSSPMTEAPAASSRPRQEHRCFVCHRTYERADHLNRHLKSRKRTLVILQGNSNAYVWKQTTTNVHTSAQTAERASTERKYSADACGKLNLCFRP